MEHRIIYQDALSISVEFEHYIIRISIKTTAKSATIKEWNDVEYVDYPYTLYYDNLCITLTDLLSGNESNYEETIRKYDYLVTFCGMFSESYDKYDSSTSKIEISRIDFPKSATAVIDLILKETYYSQYKLDVSSEVMFSITADLAVPSVDVVCRNKDALKWKRAFN